MTDIVICGEAFGEEEERQQTPFVGYSGRELTNMLDEAGIHRADCFLTNVFNLHPPGNKVEWFCGPKSEALPGYPALTKGKHVHARFAPELTRLSDEIISADPNVIIALGNTAMWALLGKTAITKFRGTTDLSTHTAAGFKVLPTYHPAAVCRQWELRPTTVLDLMKAARESKFPEVRRPKVKIYVPETIEDLHDIRPDIVGTNRLSVDIETAGEHVTCIGFAPTIGMGLVIPFYDGRRKDRSYWATQELERQAWTYVRDILELHNPPKLFQNGLYDISFLWRAYGIRVMGAEHDTMLLHHSLQPESLKGLGFLGSIYTSHSAWKQMRGKVATIKGDE